MDFSNKNINSLYNQGYIFTRVEKGMMNQTRSLRINLSNFELSSENRRVLKKTAAIQLTTHPLHYSDYNWAIGKLGKDFYEKKFGEKTFSANKIKELLTNTEKSNFNLLLTYVLDDEVIGYTICRTTNKLLHYSYPFYNLEKSPKDMGLGMMIRAIIWAKKQEKKYIYLGSASRPTDIYKLQFSGVEWFDGDKWTNNLEHLKKILK